VPRTFRLPIDEEKYQAATDRYRQVLGCSPTNSDRSTQMLVGIYESLGGLVDDVQGSNVPPGTTRMACAVDCDAFGIQMKVDTDHFVPDDEHVTIRYDIEGPLSAVDSVTLVVTDKDGAEVHRRVVVRWPGLRSGTYAWTGEVSDDKNHRRVINVIRSPYRLQLQLAVARCMQPKKSDTRDVWVRFVRVDVRIEAAGEELTDPVKELRDQHEAGVAPAKLFLDTPVFRAQSGEMYCRASYDEYERYYDGKLRKVCRVPLAARVLLLGKGGTLGRCVDALYGAEARWECKDDDSRTRAEHVFLAKIAHATGTDTNCPDELGGRRSTFPFSQAYAGWGCRELGKRRATTDLAEVRAQDPPDRSPENKTIDSGIWFSSGRMAGDTYEVKLVLDLKEMGTREATTKIGIQNWRRIELCPFTYDVTDKRDIDLTEMLDEYKKAYVKLRIMVNGAEVPKMPFYAESICSVWDSAYKAVVEQHADQFVRDAASTVLYKALDNNIRPTAFLPYDDYYAKQKGPARAAELFGAAAGSYPKRCDVVADQLLQDTAQIVLTNKGLKGCMALFLFFKGGTYSWATSFGPTDGESCTVGFAATNIATRDLGVTFLFREDIALHQKTVAHEAGHSLFLAHAKNTKKPHPAGPDVDAHEPASTHVCIMSYDTAAKEFCGICRLKLAGWNYKKIKNDGTIVPERPGCK
jgi:hypothetical protein